MPIETYKIYYRTMKIAYCTDSICYAGGIQRVTIDVYKRQAETMVMNYYRHIDRNRVQFDFMVHRQERGAYDDEIEAMGGKIYRMIPLHPFTFNTYRKQISDFFDQHPEYRIIHGHCSESGYFVYREAAGRRVRCV